MKHANYTDGVCWIAYEDDPNTTDPETVATYISTCLLADLFEVEPIKVAEDVVAVRTKNVSRHFARIAVKTLREYGYWKVQQ